MNKKANQIDTQSIRAAAAELRRFKRARSSFDHRVKEEEEFFRLRVSPKAHRNAEGESFAPRSAWLVNTVLQKHADMMENMPAAVCLAREPGDEQDAKALSAILPVVLERNNFEGTYADNMWFKLKHGICAYGVFWNNDMENGLGDIDVRSIDVRALFWQSGVRSLQDSRSVYYVQAMPEEELRARFPHYDGSGAPASTLGLCVQGEEGDMLAVVDWYYKKRN